ncbi:MAG: hypothetical protein R2688_03290 [Fimbriimonadaceae bacterium]
MREVQATNLCEAGIQDVMRDIWRPFKQSQAFTNMEGALAGATTGSPKVAKSGTIDGVGKYAAGVINYYQPVGDNYSRMVVIRAVGWMDHNNNGIADATEPRKTVDVTAEFTSLDRGLRLHLLHQQLRLDARV